MGNQSPYDRAKTYGLNQTEVRILYKITAWFNGFTLRIHDSPRTIATDYEPTLEELCGDLWESGWGDAQARLTDRGFFKDEDRGEDIYVAGRRCHWVPTKNCLKIIEQIFPNQEQVYPDWALDEHTRPPTFRDGSELMEHRKGVLAAKHLFGRLERVSGVDTYPRVNLPQRPDLRLWHHGDQLARVEVLTNHRNTETWREKFQNWRGQKAGPTIWVFENRENMVRFWNHLIDHEIINLDGGRFGGRVNNWSPQRVNDRLHRSRSGAPDYSSHDVVWTIAGIVGGDRVDAFELFDDYNIILRS